MLGVFDWGGVGCGVGGFGVGVWVGKRFGGRFLVCRLFGDGFGVGVVRIVAKFLIFLGFFDNSFRRFGGFGRRFGLEFRRYLGPPFVLGMEFDVIINCFEKEFFLEVREIEVVFIFFSFLHCFIKAEGSREVDGFHQGFIRNGSEFEVQIKVGEGGREDWVRDG